MSSHRRRTLVFAGLGLLGVWLVLGAGWLVSNRAKATAEKVAAYLHKNDLSKMSAEQRARSLRERPARSVHVRTTGHRQQRQDRK